MDVVEAIRANEPDADRLVHGQRKGVTLRLLQRKVTDPGDVAAVWRHLVAAWASGGQRPWDALEQLLAACEGARDLRRVLLYRIREAA